MFRLIRYLVLLLPIVAAADERNRISVFVSIPPQRQFVQKIAGDNVVVRVMLPPGQSPETFAPTPRMLAALADAQIYFQIGVPFETSWTDGIRSANPRIRIAACCDSLITANTMDTTHDHHDLHIWSNPAYVKILARQIRDELSLLDPSHAQQYQYGYQSFLAELDALDTGIRARLAERRIPYFIVSHAAWGYFAERYGLIQLALENNGKESGPKSLLEIVRLASKESINTVFVTAQYRTPAVESLADELQARVVELDPLAEDYLHNMGIVAEKIAGALR